MKLAAILLLMTAAVPGQTPDVTDARLETRAVSGDALAYLHRFISSESGPLWFGYAVASNRSDGNSCCWDNQVCGCDLEGGNRSFGTSSNKPVQLEGSQTLFVLARVQDHAIGKIHPVSGGCPLNAGGLRFVWLTGVDPKASLAWLAEQVRNAGSRREPDSALAAIAMHAGDAADQTMENMAEPTQPEWLREKSLFWLASARGARGFQAVRRAAERDPSPQIREKAMFDFSISKEPAAIDELIHFARQDQSAGVRGQAIFWLSQKAGERAAGAIQSSIDNDPDTGVKKKAVFALQQLPKDQGIPLLIQVAKTNKNREVRKQAMFWLGQSGDPRALAFFQEVLKSN